MNNSGKNWPPLIIANDMPPWMKARDRVLTLLMWLVLAILLEVEFQLVAGGYYRWQGFDLPPKTSWVIFADRLAPFLIVAMALVSVLFIASLRTLQRRRESLSLPQPEPLSLAEQARHVGMAEAELAVARSLPIAVVFIDPGGHHRVEAHPRSFPAESIDRLT